MTWPAGDVCVHCAGALGTEMLASAIYAPVTVAACVSCGLFYQR